MSKARENRRRRRRAARKMSFFRWRQAMAIVEAIDKALIDILEEMEADGPIEAVEGL